MRFGVASSCVLTAFIIAACSSSGGSPVTGGNDGGSSSSSGSSGSGSSSGSSSGGGSGSSSGSGAGSSSGSSSAGRAPALAAAPARAAAPAPRAAAPDAGACGTCPTGFTCNATGNYCMSAHGVPAFDHVYLIMMENESQSAITTTLAPYINSLMTTYAYTNNYSTSYHPSLPNYIDIISGTNQDIDCDCDPNASETKCTAGSSLCLSCNCGGITAQHLGDQLDAVNVEWRNYGEGMGTACNLTASEGGNATHFAPEARALHVLRRRQRQRDQVRAAGRRLHQFRDRPRGADLPLLDDRAEPLRRHARRTPGAPRPTRSPRATTG